MKARSRKLQSSLKACTLILFCIGFCSIVNGQVNLDCVDSVQVDDIAITQDFDASSPNTIISRAQHSSNADVNYAAAATLCFENEFEIKIGTEALLEILSCDTPCPCDGVICATNQTCINGICVNNATLTYGDCTADNDTTSVLGACGQTLTVSPTFNMTLTANDRIITTNNIPDHLVGQFGMGPGSLNPNAITAQNNTYTIDLNPVIAANVTQLLNTVGLPGNPPGPQYSFGIILNGIEVDPVAAEPWPHLGAMNANSTWVWNLEALGLGINLGLDCNYAHVQPTGKYHYHGVPTLHLESLNISTTAMTLIGYAADGFPIYYKYAYEDAGDASSVVIEMESSFRLKECERPGDGTAEPCGPYDGTYSNDWEYLAYAGTLDECNGRTGVTPEYPNGTYYYIITDDFPAIPRCFKGTPSIDFEI